MSQSRKQVTSLVLLVVVATPAVLGHGLHLLKGSHDHAQCVVAVASHESCGHSHCAVELATSAADTGASDATEPCNSSFTVRCQICDFLAIAHLRADIVHADVDAANVCSRHLPPLDTPFIECSEGTFLARGPPASA